VEWLSTLLATPTIGINFVADHHRFLSFLPRLGTLLDSMTKAGILFSCTRTDTEIVIIRNDGFTIKIQPNDIVVLFSYRVSHDKDPGHFPQVSKMDIRTYTELLQRTTEVLGEVIKIYFEGQSVVIKRIGLVAAATMSEADLVPGLKKFFSHLGQPWGKASVITDVLLKVPIIDREKTTDSCTHKITFNAEADKPEIYCLLDWQRSFSPPKSFTYQTWLGEYDDIKKAAADYFQKFGEGDLGYRNE
jgi:hypothetical protein